MSTYAIGDIQGCYKELRKLLDKIEFDKNKDQLWITGDLVNRGPESLEVLNYLYSLDESIITVLGNHDLHLIALSLSDGNIKTKDDSIRPILESKNKISLIEWLKSKPLMYFDKQSNTVLVHAGIHPNWSITDSQNYSNEMSSIINSQKSKSFFEHMYSDKPNIWSNQMNRIERSNLIVNCFTRMRFIGQKTELDFEEKSSPNDTSSNLLPWFLYPKRKSIDSLIIFGHWSSLNYYYNGNVVCIDGGCVWGGDLVAIDISKPESPIIVQSLN